MYRILLISLIACGGTLPLSDGGIDATVADVASQDSSVDTAEVDSSGSDAQTSDTGVDVFDAGVLPSSPWAFQIAGFGTPNYGGVAVDPNGNIAAALPLNNQYYFVQVVDSTGSPKWKKQLMGPFPYAVAMDAQGAVYVGGYTYGSFDFGGGTLGAGGFLVKYDSGGNFVWSRGGYKAWIWTVAVKSNGNVVFGGDLQGATNFGGGTMTPSNDDPFLVEITMANNFVRAKNWPGLGIVHPLVFDKNDNAIFNCNFEGTLSFGGNTLTGPNGGSGAYNYALVKLDASFNHIASRDLKTSSGVHDASVAVDANGNVAVAGGFQGSIDLGGGTLSSQGSVDVYVGEFSPTLTPKWGKRFGDIYLQGATGVAFDPNGNVGMTGIYLGGTNMNFGKGALPTMQSGSGLFLALFDASGTALASYGTFSQGGCGPVPSPSSLAYEGGPDFVVLGAFDTTCTFPSGSLFNGGAFIARLSP